MLTASCPSVGQKWWNTVEAGWRKLQILLQGLCLWDLEAMESCAMKRPKFFPTIWMWCTRFIHYYPPFLCRDFRVLIGTVDVVLQKHLKPFFWKWEGISFLVYMVKFPFEWIAWVVCLCDLAVHFVMSGWQSCEASDEFHFPYQVRIPVCLEIFH